MYYVFLIVYPPRGAWPWAWRTARVLEVRNDHRAPAPRGGEQSVREGARWSHVLRNLARGAADVRPPEPGVAGDGCRAPRVGPRRAVRSSLSVVSPNTRIYNNHSSQSPPYTLMASN